MWVTINDVDKATVFLQTLVFFVALVLVSTEYGYLIPLLEERASYLDTLIPYLLGLIEFMGAFSVAKYDMGCGRLNSEIWWLSLTCLSGGGVCAYLYTLWKCKQLNGSILKRMTLNNVIKNVVIVGCIGIVCFLVYLFFPFIPLYVRWLISVLIIIAFIIMMLTSHSFILEIDNLSPGVNTGDESFQ